MLISLLGFGFVYMLIGKALIPVVESILRSRGYTRSNYREVIVPTGFGIYLYAMLIVFTVLLYLWPDTSSAFFEAVTPLWGPSQHQFLIITGLIMCTGWMDDMKGNRVIKGFKGHLRSLLSEGVVTTGIMKAGVTGCVALWVVVEQRGAWYEVLLRFLIIVLSTNAINLLDLRPGRAIKGFYLGSICLFVLTEPFMFLPYWLPVALAVLLILPMDLNGKLMLGDTGANLLGFILGFSLAIVAPNSILLILCLLLAAMHWISERSSLTAIIEKSTVLNLFDRWGRLR